VAANQEIKGPATGPMYLECARRDGEALVPDGIHSAQPWWETLKVYYYTVSYVWLSLEGQPRRVWIDHLGAQREALKVAKRRGIKGASGRVIQPWHFPGSAVCHDNAGCGDGRDPHRGERLPGTGGKPICGICARLNDRAKQRCITKWLALRARWRPFEYHPELGLLHPALRRSSSRQPESRSQYGRVHGPY
jgi:hypothetical protein